MLEFHDITWFGDDENPMILSWGDEFNGELKPGWYEADSGIGSQTNAKAIHIMLADDFELEEEDEEPEKAEKKTFNKIEAEKNKDKKTDWKTCDARMEDEDINPETGEVWEVVTPERDGYDADTHEECCNVN